MMGGFLGLPGFNKAPVAAAATGWTRPASWPALPTSANNQVDILAAVWNDTSNYAAVKITTSAGTYSVDWGDGTSSTGVTSGVAAEHQYDYTDVDLDSGTVSEFGYKTALIQITPDSANITQIDLGVLHSRTGLQSNFGEPWLDCHMQAASATSIRVAASGSQGSPYLQHCHIYNAGALTVCYFAGSHFLEKVTIDAGLSSITNPSYSFQGCQNLRQIELHAGAYGAATNIGNMFNGCTSLEEFTWPALGTVTTADNCFLTCSSLKSVTWPAGSLQGAVSMGSCFNSCYSLEEVTFPSGSLASVTNITQLFRSCYSIRKIEFPSGSLTGSANSLANTFDSCSSLEEIIFPSGGLANVTSSTSSAFASCYNLRRIQNCAIKISFTLANCSIGATELDEIYTALPTITSQTITVTGNHGTDADTPTIATAKGWTVS